MVALALALWSSLAWAGPCGELDVLQEAADGGWLMTAERACLHRKAAHRSRFQAQASRLLLADARALRNTFNWKVLAERHVQIAPEDGDVWVGLVQELQRDGRSQDVVTFASQAIDASTEWAFPQEDARLLGLHRMRTYAALQVRRGRGIDEEVVSFAKAWLEVARDRAPAVAWDLAGEAPPES